jgi:MoaA/NifB/PqqE/SkfB family radical SAM enzyme
MWQVKSGENDMTLEEWKKFIEELHSFLGYPIEINILGGEPLLKGYIYELISFIRNRNFRATMATNGFLINTEVANKITESGLNTLGISLDSLNGEIHDYLRGVKGVYRKAVDAIDLIYNHKSECKIDILTIIMGKNLDDIVKLADWVNADERIASINFMAIMKPHCSDLDSFWYKHKDYSFLWPGDTQKANEIIDQLIARKKKEYKITNPVPQLEKFKLYFQSPTMFVRQDRCHFDDVVLNVSTNGNVHLCWDMEPIGSIRANSIKEIWASDKAMEIRQKIKGCRKNCEPMINCCYED